MIFSKSKMQWLQVIVITSLVSFIRHFTKRNQKDSLHISVGKIHKQGAMHERNRACRIHLTEQALSSKMSVKEECQCIHCNIHRKAWLNCNISTKQHGREHLHLDTLTLTDSKNDNMEAVEMSYTTYLNSH
jgi:hypothetical protein